MDLWLNIILIIGPLLLGIYLSTIKRITRKRKIIVWIICLSICFCGVYGAIKEKKGEEQEVKVKKYYRQLQERQILYSMGFPEDYIGGLGENPLLKHFFNAGQKYEKESKFKEAIEEYKKCLTHPNATEENKVAANILIGSCYYMLSKLKEAEKHYKKALNISKRVKDKDERLRGKAVALGNIGLVYRDLGKPDEALKYLEDALEIYRKIGYEQGVATNLGNIGLIYRDLGKPDEALKYHQDALEIHRKIGYEQGVATNLGNIGIIYSNLGKPDEALKYHQDALEIFKRIGAQPQIEITLKNINIIEEEKKREYNKIK